MGLPREGSPCVLECRPAERCRPEKRGDLSGKTERLTYLSELLGLAQPLPASLRYQLLHRSASAIIEAARFKTDEAAMVVHSFSETHEWFDDFAAFLDLLGVKAVRNQLQTIGLPSGLPMHSGWASGDRVFLTR